MTKLMWSMCLKERPLAKHLGKRFRKGGYDTESKQAYLHRIEEYAEENAPARLLTPPLCLQVIFMWRCNSKWQDRSQQLRAVGGLMPRIGRPALAALTSSCCAHGLPQNYRAPMFHPKPAGSEENPQEESPTGRKPQRKKTMC